MDDYKKLKDFSKKIYSDTKSVPSLFLNDKVYFTSKGFNHIIFKNKKSERDRASQCLRFKLIPTAIKLISLSTTYQEFDCLNQDILVKSRRKKILKNKIVKYWGLIAIIDGFKIKVIIRKIGENGFFHFWSVIPSWKTNKSRDSKLLRIMKGDPEVD
jgi:hypothetical protein